MTTPTEPAPFNPETTPFVTLAGKQWPIPMLVPRQLRNCRRQIIDLTDAIAPDVPLAQEGDAAGLAAVAESTGDKVMAMTNSQWERLQEAVYWGLTRAHPTMTMEEFLDMPSTDGDMFKAFLVVRTQSGIYTPVKEGDAKPAAGEEPAAS